MDEEVRKYFHMICAIYLRSSRSNQGILLTRYAIMLCDHHNDHLLPWCDVRPEHKLKTRQDNYNFFRSTRLLIKIHPKKTSNLWLNNLRIHKLQFSTKCQGQSILTGVRFTRRDH